MRLQTVLTRTDEGTKRLAALGLSLITIWIIFELLTDGLFLTPRNFYNLAVQSSAVAVVTVGMVMVITTRNIDLSVGSVLGFVGMIIALLQIQIFPADAIWNWPVSVVVGLAVGTLIGIWQGFLVAYVRIPSFVVTLAGLLIFRGAAFEVAQGQTLSPFQDAYRIFGGGESGSLGEAMSWAIGVACVAIAVVYALGRGTRANAHRTRIFHAVVAIVSILLSISMFNAYDRPHSDLGQGIPSPINILGGDGSIAILFAVNTPIGRYMRAIGKDIEAARLVGVPTRLVVLKVFGVIGALCAVGAIITTSRLNAGTTNLGTLMELNVIAAAVIGGASLDGGRGSILGGILGAFVIQSLDTGMVLLGVSSSMRQILIGFVLLGAVWFDRVAASQRQGA